MLKRSIGLALVAVVALAGSATAAKLITGKQIKDSSLTGQDVKNRSLTARDFRGSVRPADARPHLRAALETFQQLGAEPWSRRSRAELRASGGAAPPARHPVSRELTAQELEVAVLVARGSTNREAAAALFLSPKTVEAHLSRIYRKLELRSRTELAAAIAAGEPGPH